MSRGFLLLPASIRNLFVLHSHRQLRELFLFQLLFSFAFSLIIIFEPVFFYQLGISLELISLYYALHYTLYVVLMPLGAQVAARFGLERSLALSMPFFVIYFLVLAAIPTQPSLFWLALVFLTLHKIFYWPAYHANFAKFTDGKNRGTEQSWMRFITYGTGILGPLVGGVIAARFGFPLLFILAAVTVMLATLPLLKTREHFQEVSLPYSSAWQIIRARPHRRMVISMVGWAEDLIGLVFWPIWLYLFLGSTAKIGALAAVSIAAMTVWGFMVGELIDRHGARWVLRRLGVPVLVLANILRLFAVTSLRVIGVDIVGRVANLNYTVPFTSQLHANAKRFGALQYALAFETVLAISKATLAYALAGVFLYATPDVGFATAWIIAIVFGLLYAVI